MAYQKIDIESSYLENDLGRFIYNEVVRLKPDRVVEFGALNGYSTVAIAMGLRDNGGGHLYAYDLCEKYPYKHTQPQVCLNNLREHGLESYVTIDQVNFWDWLAAPEEFDMLHIDISNTGKIISAAAKSLQPQLDSGAAILFEGGSATRDAVGWMTRFSKQPIFPLKSTLGYKILCEDYPSISIIEGTKID